MNQAATRGRVEPDAPVATEEYVARFQRDGFVEIEDAVPSGLVARIRRVFMDAMETKVERFALAPVVPTDGRDRGNSSLKIDFRPEGANHDLNRWNMHLPTHPMLLHQQLIANPVALPVIKALLGPEPVAFLIASDTPYPGAGFQNIHQDFTRFGLTVNVPLVDFTDDNAPLEVWPASHVRPGPFHRRKVNLSTDELRALGPGKRMLLKAGSIFIRDQRLVHRGTANAGTSPRPCLSIWYKDLSITGTTIPVPHRGVADRMAKLALWMRREGRGTGGAVRNRTLLNLGNYFGRIVEETSASDRDHRRRIPREMWDGLSPEMRSLLRYASVDGVPEEPRSVLGSAILAAAGVAFAARAWQLKVTSRSAGRR